MSVTRRTPVIPGIHPLDARGRARGSHRSRRTPRPPWSPRRRSVPLVPLVVTVGVGALVYVAASFLPVRTTLDGALQADAVVRPDALAAGTAVQVSGPFTAGVRVRLGAVDLAPDGAGRYVLPTLPDGQHEVRIDVARRFLPDRHRTVRFTVDATPPSLTVPATVEATIDAPVVLTVRSEPGATLTVNDVPAATPEAGTDTVEITVPAGAAGPLRVVATDAAGNRTEQQVTVRTVYPGARGIHVSFDAWSDPGFRAQLFRLLDERRIDTVQLDLKDETGAVGFATTNTVARDIGAVDPGFDLADAVRQLEARGARVVGRIVAFRDPVLAAAMWEQGRREWVLQTPQGEMLGAYGGFSNYANDGVRDYNLDLAEEAARAGVRDILWDYIRRPEGNPESMVVPGRGDTPSSEFIASFLAEGRARLRPLGAYQGASVFGIAATRGQFIAQDIPAMAEHTDYLAPMLYPSHWNPGEYGVDDPNRQPYDIIRASLADFQRVLERSGTPLVPWLQDFDDGVPYGVAEVQAQIRAAADLGVDSWLLWNSRSVYTLDALEPLP